MAHFKPIAFLALTSFGLTVMPVKASECPDLKSTDYEAVATQWDAGTQTYRWYFRFPRKASVSNYRILEEFAKNPSKWTPHDKCVTLPDTEGYNSRFQCQNIQSGLSFRDGGGNDGFTAKYVTRTGGVFTHTGTYGSSYAWKTVTSCKSGIQWKYSAGQVRWDEKIANDEQFIIIKGDRLPLRLIKKAYID